MNLPHSSNIQSSEAIYILFLVDLAPDSPSYSRRIGQNAHDVGLDGCPVLGSAVVVW